jgi:hypothetical protein
VIGKSKATTLKPYGHTPSGFINEEKAILWLDNFLENAHIPMRRRRTSRPYCLLLMDGHSSHTSPEFIDKCYEWGIIPFCLVLVRPLTRFDTEVRSIPKWAAALL